MSYAIKCTLSTHCTEPNFLKVEAIFLKKSNNLNLNQPAREGCFLTDVYCDRDQNMPIFHPKQLMYFSKEGFKILPMS